MRLKFKNADEKREWIEIFVGGACGVLAILAAIVEYCLGDNGALAGMFKDIFGTAVVVVLLFASMPKRKPKNLVGILEQAVEDWGLDNAPVIFKSEEYEQAKDSNKTQSFVLLQDPKKEYINLVNAKLKPGSSEWTEYANASKHNHRTGKFLDMPSYEDMVQGKFEILLCLEQKHFTDMDEIDSIINNLEAAINVHIGEKMTAKRTSASQKKIRLSCEQIESEQDVNEFVDALDFILSLVKVIA